MKQDKMIWLGIVFSTFVYAVIVYTIAPSPEGSFEDAVGQQMPMILYGAALAAFVAGLIAPNLMRAPARVKMIISLAIFESCVIFGLMAAFLTRDWRLFVPTWIVGLLGMWRVYPSDAEAGAGATI